MTLLDIVKSNYAKAYQCAKKVEIYLEKFQHYKTSKDELLYLTIHIQKITQDHH